MVELYPYSPGNAREKCSWARPPTQIGEEAAISLQRANRHSRPKRYVLSLREGEPNPLVHVEASFLVSEQPSRKRGTDIVGLPSARVIGLSPAGRAGTRTTCPTEIGPGGQGGKPWPPRTSLWRRNSPPYSVFQESTHSNPFAIVLDLTPGCQRQFDFIESGRSGTSDRPASKCNRLAPGLSHRGSARTGGCRASCSDCRPQRSNGFRAP